MVAQTDAKIGASNAHRVKLNKHIDKTNTKLAEIARTVATLQDVADLQRRIGTITDSINVIRGQIAEGMSSYRFLRETQRKFQVDLTAVQDIQKKVTTDLEEALPWMEKLSNEMETFTRQYEDYTRLRNCCSPRVPAQAGQCPETRL